MATTDTGGKLITLDELKPAVTGSKGYTASQISALSEAVEEELSAQASTYVCGTLYSSAWAEATDANGDLYYHQAVTVSSVTEDTNGIVGLADECTADEYEAAASAGLSIYSQSSGSIVIAAY